MVENTINHDGIKPFACSACPSRFTRQENLNRHTTSVHRLSSRRPYPCPHCEISFSRSDLRKRHIGKCHAQQTGLSEHGSTAVDNVALYAQADVVPHATTTRTSSVAQEQFPSFAELDAERIPANDDAEHWQNGSNMNHAQLSSVDFNVFSQQNISWLFKLPQFITSFFERFQPSLPILHQQSFDLNFAKEPLLQAMACVGAVYHSPQFGQSVSLALFEAGLKSLDKYVSKDSRTRFRELWVMQAYVLLEYYAIYSCSDKLYIKALRIHRRLIDAARQYQLLQGSVTASGSETGSNPSQSPIIAHSSSCQTPTGSPWRTFIETESRKRVMYGLYYLDAQLAICCNVRSMLTALELKYELPCRDDMWSAPTSEIWTKVAQSQDILFNNGNDNNANGDPRPPHGDLYESLMHLMNHDPPGRSLGLLWYSSFASMMLVLQIQMMARDLTMASTFLYNNIRCDDTRHNLSIISESNRAPMMQALMALADLMPRSSSPFANLVPGDHEINPSVERALWYPVWIAWHYTAISLSHQDALMTSGIVEYSIPTAISTAWELGKPRAKQHRDVYEDRDVTRIVSHLEVILALLSRPAETSVGSDVYGAQIDSICLEDPFTTLLGFKACMMGWRVVRLVTLGLEQNQRSNIPGSDMPNTYSISAKLILERVMRAMTQDSRDCATMDIDEQILGSRTGHLSTGGRIEARYLEWMQSTFASRNLWPPGQWIVTVFSETRPEAG